MMTERDKEKKEKRKETKRENYQSGEKFKKIRGTKAGKKRVA